MTLSFSYEIEPKLSLKIENKICICVKCHKKSLPKSRVCRYHKHLRFKETNPYSYWYSVLKQNAKRRQIPFELTVDEFKDFCIKENYLENKGRSSESYTIDRKKSNIGYRRDNIQILTNSNNVKKMWVDLKIQNGTYPSKDEFDSMFVKEKPKNTDSEDSDCPF